MRFYLFIFIFLIFISKNLYSDETSEWLKREIDIILEAYKNQNLSNENRFLLIEKTINNNFAGTGIAKFVAGEAWKKSDKNTKKIYIDNFKRHLALNIASMMQGYSDQTYELTKSKYDNKNQITLIDMEIFSDTGAGTYYNDYFWEWKPDEISAFPAWQAISVICIALIVYVLLWGNTENDINSCHN